MCSVEERNSNLTDKTPISRTCVKCKQPAQLVIRANNSFCSDCFKAYFVHKFRATIGRSKLVRSNEKILLAYSGGSRSSAMLHLVHEGLDPTVHKKLRFLPGVVYIDDGVVLKLTVEERQQHLGFIRRSVEKTGFPLHYESLAKVLSTNQSRTLNVNNNSEISTSHDNMDIDEDEQLLQVFDKICDTTAKEDLLQTLRKTLIIQIAEKHGYTKVMFADCANRLAVTILSEIARGRGASVAHQMSFADYRYENVTIIRPMKEFLSKEVALYLTLKDINYKPKVSLTTMMPNKSSIERVTEGFVTDLQACFPSTVSTICRTGDKLSTDDNSDTQLVCCICNSRLDTSAAIDYPCSSKLENTSTGRNCEQGGCCCGDDDRCSRVMSSSSITIEDVRSCLCYGCKIAFRYTNWTLDDLPPFVLNAAKRQMRRKQMRDEIGKFLLD